MTSIERRTVLATMQAPAAPLPPPIGHDDDVGVGPLGQDLQGVGTNAGDEIRLVPGMDVAVAVLGGLLLALLARVVEVAAVEDDLARRAPASTRP